MKEFKIRTPVNRWIAVSSPRSDQYCMFCMERVKQIGIIIYLANKTFRTYDWMHIGCLTTKVIPSKQHPDIIQNMSQRRLYNQDVPTHTTHQCTCSYCDMPLEKLAENEGLYRFSRFYLHPKCIPLLISDVQKVLQSKGPMYAAILI